MQGRHLGVYRDEGGPSRGLNLAEEVRYVHRSIKSGHGEGELPGLMKVRQDSWTLPGRTSIVSTREDTGDTKGTEKSNFPTRMQGDKTGEAPWVWTCSTLNDKLGLGLVDVGNSLKTLNQVRSWSNQSLHKLSLAVACRMDQKGRKSEVQNLCFISDGSKEAWTKAVTVGQKRLWTGLNWAWTFTVCEEMWVRKTSRQLEH